MDTAAHLPGAPEVIMVLKIAVLFATFVYKAFLYRAGVEWLSPSGNTRRHRATTSTSLWLVLLFSALEAAAWLFQLVPFAALALGVVHLVLFFFIFGEYFGLGIKRTFGLIALQWVGMGLLAMALRLVPALS